jgi:hypothetical protein
MSTRAELAGFLCNAYLRRCDIVGSGNPECFGINPNATEIHRCCSNPDQGQPEDRCFAEWPKGAKPATFNVCCTPGIRYGCSAYFYLLNCCPAVNSFGTIHLNCLITPLYSHTGLLPNHYAVVHVCSLATRALSLLPMILFSRNFSGHPSTVTSQQTRI